MKKFFVFVMSLVMVLSLTGMAVAGSNCNGNGSCSTTNNNTYNTTNEGGNGYGGVGIGFGGSAKIEKGAVENNNDVNVGNGIGNFSPSAKATATIEEGAVKNYNANVQGQIQGQMQGQMQGQVQGQNNGQIISPKQELTIINPENKRDLPNIVGYQAPGQLEYRGPYEKGIQTKAKPWLLKKEWGKSEIEGFYSMTDSAKCKVFRIQKVREATDALKVATEGPISCVLECTADSGFEMWGTAGLAAMDCGAKAIEEAAYYVTFANKSSGWNIGIGGGVTAINGGNDNYGGSVGGGTGIGSVTTAPVEKVSAIFIAR